MLDALDKAAGEDSRWRAKRSDFAGLTLYGQLLDMRGEFAVALALTSARIRYRPGNTKVPNPDFLLTHPGEEGAGPVAGVEVTAVAPSGIAELSERIESELGSDSGLGVRPCFSSYPSRLCDGVVDQVLTAVHDQAPAVVRGVRGLPGRQRAAKAAQGRSLGGAPVVLAVDISRSGAAWMRPAWVWAGELAAARAWWSGAQGTRDGTGALVGVGRGWLWWAGPRCWWVRCGPWVFWCSVNLRVHGRGDTGSPGRSPCPGRPFDGLRRAARGADRGRDPVGHRNHRGRYCDRLRVWQWREWLCAVTGRTTPSMRRR